MPRLLELTIHLDRLHGCLQRPQRQQRALRPRLRDIAAQLINHLLWRKGQDLFKRWMIAIDALGQIDAAAWLSVHPTPSKLTAPM